MKGSRLPGIRVISLVDSLQAGGQEFEPPQLHQLLYEGKLHLITIPVNIYYQLLPQ